MKAVRCIAASVLVLAALACVLTGFLAPADYATQFREAPSAAPSRHHLLGTDDLGRDSFSRLLYGTRVSLLLAPAAALLSTLLAAFVGGIAGYVGGPTKKVAMAVTDLFLSMPWLFLLIIVRAMLPLNVSPGTSVTVTFLLLGLLGWAASARVVAAEVQTIRHSDFMLQAQASGISPWRLLALHITPNVRPVLFAQFWISIPVFILSEANLGILGLGVAEPLPSWGSLLRELESFVSFGDQPWRFVPLLLLILVVSSFQIFLSRKEVQA
ncbi:MAG: ABC transporter permease [Acidobacteriia bacterium]|nr:ABC transporter permease [Terriglobia bacterium]